MGPSTGSGLTPGGTPWTRRAVDLRGRDRAPEAGGLCHAIDEPLSTGRATSGPRSARGRLGHNDKAFLGARRSAPLRPVPAQGGITPSAPPLVATRVRHLHRQRVPAQARARRAPRRAGKSARRMRRDQASDSPRRSERNAGSDPGSSPVHDTQGVSGSESQTSRPSRIRYPGASSARAIRLPSAAARGLAARAGVGEKSVRQPSRHHCLARNRSGALTDDPPPAR